MTYEVKDGEMSVMVFVNTHKDKHPKAPSHNVVIKLPDGSEFKGGLWTYTSEKAGKFLSGSVRKDDGEWKTRNRESNREPNEIAIDF